MGKVKDLTGKVFGQLTVLSFSHTTTNGAYWLCRCTCGTEKVVPSKLLKNGRAVSCGCRKAQIVRSTIERSIERRREMFGTIDLVGKRFGSLTVLERVACKHHDMWLCRCDCGKLVTKPSNNLAGANPSCGCRQGVRRRLDLTGQRFGRLVALEYDEAQSKIVGRSCWRCQCDCGNSAIVVTNLLTSGHTQSCGCLQREHTSRLGASVGVENGKAQSKYDWNVKVSGKRVALRSSFEVIFAKYLLKHRIRFEYEPRRIQLAPDTIYIPDFYMPDTDTRVEVKGYASERWQRKRAMFERAGYRLLVVTEASIASYLPGIKYGVWMERNAHKYLRNP